MRKHTIPDGKSVSSTGHHMQGGIANPWHLRALRCGVTGYE